MKNLTIVPILFLAQLLFANSDKYTEVMQKNILAAYRAKTIEEHQALTNTFHRIGEAEKTKWEPFYYEAYNYIMMANKESEGAKKDTYLDLALKALENAKYLQPNESELEALEGFVHMLRVTVDPGSRGQKYSGMAFQSFNKAVGINPENPRALSLLAQMEYGTAQFYGSSTTEACATTTKPIEKFDVYKTENPLAPTGGKEMTEGLKAKCK